MYCHTRHFWGGNICGCSLYHHKSMAVLIGNISIEAHHCKGFLINDHFPLLTWKFSPLKVLPCMVDYVYCDQGEITRLVCTKYTHLYYSTYLNCCVSYSYKFSKWCWFSIVSYTSNKYFIAKLCLGNKLLNLKFWKGSWLNFICKPNFLMLGHV